MSWFQRNQEWVFSGIGTGLVLAVISWVVARRKRSGTTQIQHGGDHSTNLQAGRDIGVGSADPEGDDS